MDLISLRRENGAGRPCFPAHPTGRTVRLLFSALPLDVETAAVPSPNRDARSWG